MSKSVPKRTPQTIKLAGEWPIANRKISVNRLRKMGLFLKESYGQSISYGIGIGIGIGNATNRP